VKRRVARRTYHREKCTVNPAAVTCLTTSDGGRVAHESRRDVSPLAVKPPRLRPEFAESVKSRVTILARRAIDVLTDRPRTVFRPVGAARYFSQARAKLREYIVALVINLTAAADGVARVTSRRSDPLVQGRPSGRLRKQRPPACRREGRRLRRRPRRW
jgi:hypothetical protein